MHRKLPLLLLPALLLGACATDPNPFAPTTAETFGEAVRHNMAVQIIDPEPEDLALPPTDGDRTLLMTGRYKTDKVKKPEETTIGPLSGGSTAK
jgi:hypothetical protein